MSQYGPLGIPWVTEWKDSERPDKRETERNGEGQKGRDTFTRMSQSSSTTFLVLISFHSYLFFSSPSTSFPRSPLHEYTLNASRPSQLYFRQCYLVTGIYPITPRRCLYYWLLSSLTPSTCEHPSSHCISFLLIHFEICCIIG